MNTEIIDNNLLSKAQALVREVEADNETRVNELLDDIARMREASLFQELGKMTRELHESLNGFRFDARITDLAEHDIPDAKERLNYVITMTSQAAHRTLTAVEETIPLSEQLERRAGELKGKWQRLLRKEMNKQEFKELSREVSEFLPLVEEKSNKIHSNLSDVLIAQDYQDITGQIIQRVISLVQDVEDNLVNLIRISGQKMQPATTLNGASKSDSASKLEGPQINSQGRADVVAGQDAVDDLLSSLG
ncbi:MAG: protein phosphatase CheZ, partial [Pseudomonadota bacterium]